MLSLPFSITDHPLFIVDRADSIVGIIFITFSAIKSLNPKKFIIQVKRYSLFPQSLAAQIAVFFLGFEAFLGLCLVLHLGRPWCAISSIALLVITSMLILWGALTERVQSCGCYGELLFITPRQSVALNLTYIAFIFMSSLTTYSRPDHLLSLYALCSLASLGIILFAWRSRDSPVVDFSRLKIGSRLDKQIILQNMGDQSTKSFILAFMSCDCIYCKALIPFLNMIHANSKLPEVQGLLSISSEKLDEFQIENKIRFPLKTIDKLRFQYLVDAVPTCCLVENGIIKQKWMGRLPDELMNAIMHIYDTSLLQKSTDTSVPSEGKQLII